MKRNFSVCSSIPVTEQPNSLKILSEFQVDQHQCLIICLETESDTQFLTDDSLNQLNTYVELNRFEIEGRLFAIVQTKPIDHLENTTDLDLATLLTERELQIAVLVASGRVNKQIATQLCISEWTVSTHLRRIFIKLGVDSRAAMVYKCAPMIQKLAEQVEVLKTKNSSTRK